MPPFPLVPRFVGATPVSISVPTMVIEAVILIGMVWLMEVLVFSPIRKAWREREQSVQSGLEASVAVREEAADVHEEVRRILSEARRQSQRSIDEVTTEGERLRAERIAEATAEFQRLLNEARVEIQAEQAQAAAQLRNQVIDLALQAAAKVTGRSYDEPETRQLAAAVVGRESLV